MKKRFGFLLISISLCALLFSLCGISASASEVSPAVSLLTENTSEVKATASTTYSGTCGANLAWTLDTATGVLKIEGSGAMTNYRSSSAPWYSYRSSIKSLEIGNSVTSIGSNAFFYCPSLTSVTIGNGVTSIGEDAFASCTSLTSITVPNNVKSIDIGTFSGCTSLESITLPFVGEASYFTSNHHLGYIFGASSYSYNYDYVPTSLKTVVLTGLGLNGIDAGAFYDCSSLTSVTLPDSVTYIDNYAFYYCSSLTSVNIGNNVTRIGAHAFYDCYSLTRVYITDLAKWCEIDFGDSSANPLYYAKKLYLNGELVTELVIPYGVTSIGSYAFTWCDSLTSITIPNSVTSISSSAFEACYSLTSIVIPFVGASRDANGYMAHFGYIFGYSGSNSSSSGSHYYDSTAKKYYTYYIPSSLKNVTISNGVTSIASYAFRNCDSLTSVTIPNSVTSIGDYSFEYCGSLTSITIPNSITSIGYAAFYNCTSLKSVYITDLAKWCVIDFDTPSANPLSCGAKLYLKGELVTELVIPDSITSIGSSAFCYCASITSITIPNSVKSIGENAFSGCSSLTSITIPNSVRSISSRAFYGCYKLIEVINKSSLDIVAGSSDNGYVAYYAKEVHNQESKIANKDGYLFYTFDGANYLVGYIGEDTELILPESYNGRQYVINDYAFYDCDSLTSVTISEGVTSIGDYAFYDCDSLTSITIPNSVTGIGEYAFNGCSKIIENENGVLYVDKWVIGCDSSLTAVAFRDDTIGIADSSFKDCDYLVSVTIPDSVIIIGDYAFNECSSLTSVMLGNGVTSIGDYAFYRCESLTSVTIPDSVTSIGNYAFYKCFSLTSVTLGKGVTGIGNYAFVYCSSLTSITIPDSVKSIGAYAFYYCYSLTGVTLGNGVTSIGDYAFYECESLTSITLPNSVTSIGSFAFAYCKSLTSITIPNSVTSIGDGAFRGCPSLESIALPFVGATLNGTENTHFGYIFGASSYSYNDDYVPASLKSVEITGVTSIGPTAFRGCTSLTNVTIGNSVIKIESGAFLGCTSLESITIPFIGISRDASGHKSHFGYIFGYSASSSSSSEYHYLEISANNDPSANNFPFDTIYTYYTYYIPSSLKNIIISEGVTSIGSDAFYNCTSLTSVTIPSTVTKIGISAFYKCTSLKSVCITDLEKWCEIDKNSNPLSYGAKLYLNGELVSDHSFGDWVQITAPSCLTVGSESRKCARCGYYETRVIKSLGHDMSSASCTEISECKRSDCDFMVGSALGHSFVTYVSNNDATCTADGTKTAKCERCNKTDTITESNTKLGHNFVNYTSDNNATCAAEGTKTAKCEHCTVTDTITDTNSKRGHSMGSWSQTSAPNCTEKGAERRDCASCDHYETREVAALGHDMSSATCTEAAKCKRSGCNHTVGSALGHSFANDATCDICGYVRFYITYDANGGSNTPENMWVEADSVKISSQTPHKSGYVFVGWRILNGGDTVYQAGSTVSITGDVSLWATWKKNCSYCNGEGTENFAGTCSSCSGTGRVNERRYCSTCSGTGDAIAGQCAYCLGTGSLKDACSSCRGFGGTIRCSCTCGNVWSPNTTGRRICSKCGRTVTGERIATCTWCSGSGLRDKTCSPCGGTGKTWRDCSSCGGTGSKYVETNCGTCSGTGTAMAVRACSICDGKKYAPDCEIHTYGAWIALDAIYHYNTCSVCDNIQYKEHAYTRQIISDTYKKSDADCDSQPVYYYCCEICDAKGTETFEYGDILGHTGGTATCIAQAICTRCGQPHGDALGHDMSSATCTGASKCKRSGCNHTVGTALGHTWNSGEVILEPTVEAVGKKLFSCTVCTATKTEDIPKLTFVVGDIDGSEEITSADAVYLLMNTFFPEDYPISEEQKQESDFDGDGEVNSGDAVYLLMYTFFPEDYPIVRNSSLPVMTVAILPSMMSANKKDEKI